ncbi:MAG: Ig-like domain-containing protein [Pseudomonadota bacterium]
MNTTTSGRQRAPEVSALSDGGYVVVWQDESGADGSSYGVFGQRFAADGSAQGGEFQINTTTSGQQDQPDVVALPGGGFVVVWQSYADSQWDVRAQIFDAEGNAQGSEFLVNQSSGATQYQPSITATADGGFFVSWYSDTSNGDSYTYDIMGRHFDAAGVAQADEQVITQDGNGSGAQRPEVVGLSNGGIVVGWDYPAAQGDGSGRGVFQRFLELEGSALSLSVPVLEALDPLVEFDEASLQVGAQLLDASGAVAVSGTADFDGGVLIVDRVAAQSDLGVVQGLVGQDSGSLAVRHQGNGAGEIGVAGTQISYGGVEIATIVRDGGNGGALEIVFNANADRQAVEAVVENLTYQSRSDAPPARIDLVVLLSDGNGATSEPQYVTVAITPELDAPAAVWAMDQQVNSFSAGQQNEPAVAALSDGGWVVLWQSVDQDRPGAGNWGIIGQRYDAAGAPVGGEFLVNSQTQGGQYQVDVTALEAGPNAGGFVASWYDDSSPDNLYVRAQVFAADGSRVGAEIAVPSDSYSTQYQPSVQGLADGSFVVVWSAREPSDGYEIFMRRFDGTGSPLGDEAQVNTVTSSTQDQPDVTLLANGGYAVSWRSYDSGSYDIALRLFAADGSAQSDEIVVGTWREGTQDEPQIVGLADGRLVVVWTDQSGLDGSGYGVFGQIFGADGSAEGPQFLINEQTSSTQYQPSVTALDDGGFAVAYYSSATSTELQMQYFDSAGLPVDGAQPINPGATGYQDSVELATLANGDVIAVYADQSGRDGSSYGVFQQIFGDAANYTDPASRPNVVIASPAVTFDENLINVAPQILFEGVNVGAPEAADFTGGTLSIFATAPALNLPYQNFQRAEDDQLGLRNQGTGAGEIALSGTSVTYGGVEIARLTSDGSDGQALSFELTAAATPEAIEALLQNVTFANLSDEPLASREFQVRLQDGAGNQAQPVTVDVVVRAEAEATALQAISDELQANSHEYSTQNNPAVAALATGGHVAVWQSYDQDATNTYAIVAQRFDSAGQPLGQETVINVTTAGSQQEPETAGLLAGDGGGYVVVWQGQSGTVLHGRLLNDDGSARGGEFQINTETYSTQYQPVVSAVPGGFAVVWTSYNNETYSYDIRGQLFASDGSLSGAEFTVNTSQTDGTQAEPQIAVDALGNMVVVWDDHNGTDGSGHGIFAQRLAADGSRIGSEFQVNTVSTGGQVEPQVAYLNDGRFVVAWTDQTGLDGSSYGVFAQIFAADGSAEGSQFQVSPPAPEGTQYLRDLVALADGGFAIGYDGDATGDSSGVFLQQYDSSGGRVDGEIRLNQNTASTQSELQLVAVQDGTATGVAAVWASAGNGGDGSGQGVFTRVFGLEGDLATGNRAPVLEDLADVVRFGVSDITSPMVLDPAIKIADLDSSDFAGGTVELRHSDHRGSVNDQLSILSGKGITLSGTDVLFDGEVIATIDGSANGVDGADLVLNLTAAATVDNLRYLLEQLAFSSSNPINGEDRSLSLRLSDGDGAISAGRGIRVEIETNTPAVGIRLQDLDTAPEVSAAMAQAGVRLQPNLDFAYDRAAGFDGGYVELDFDHSVTNRLNGASETLDIGSFDGISRSGDDVFYRGVQIGSVDDSRDGAAGAALRINLLAAADAEAVDSLLQALTYQTDAAAPANEVQLHLQVRDGESYGPSSVGFDLNIVSAGMTPFVPLEAEQQVNAYGQSDQDNAALTRLADGGLIVTWESDGQDGSSIGIYQQRYDSAGQPMGAEIQVNATASGAQHQPDVAALADGGWVTVWTGQDASHEGIIARITAADGSQGVEFTVNLQTSWTQDNPQVTTLANGNFVVSWTSRSSGGAGDGNGEAVVGRVFAPDGTALSATDIVLNTTTEGTQRDVALDSFATSGFVAVWESYLQDGSGYAIVAQRFDDLGTPVGAEQVVNTTTEGSQQNAQVAVLADGGFVVTWQSGDASGDGIFLQRFAADGSAVGAEVQVNDWSGSNQSDPQIVALGDGGFVVGFYDNSYRNGGYSYDLWAQRYGADGNAVGGNVRLNSDTTSTQYQLALESLESGGFAAIWSSYANDVDSADGDRYGVFIRRFDESLAPSDAPVLAGLSDVSLAEVDLNAGYQSVFAAGSLAVLDPDSADFAGGRLMIHRVEQHSHLAQFNAPDDLSQDNLRFDSSAVTLVGDMLQLEGVTIGTLVADGQAGAGLEVELNGNATADRVETLLESLAYQNRSQGPASSRSFEVTLSDGDGGTSLHQSFDINIIPERDALVPLGDERQVNSIVEHDQSAPDVAALAGGGHVVVWQSNRQDGDGWGVFAQRFDANDRPIGTEFQVTTSFAGTQSEPTVVGLSDGSFVVAWQGNGTGDSSGVFAQRFDAAGHALGQEFRLNENTSSSDTDVQLAPAADGGFLAVWYSSTGSDLQARLYDSAGVAQGGEFTVNTTASGTQYEPAVTALASGGYAVVWRDSTNPDGIHMQRIAADGSLVGSEVEIEGLQSASTPDVVGLSGGGFVAVWTDNSGADGSGYGIYARLYDDLGQAQGARFLVNEQINGTQNEPQVAALADGGFIITFSDHNGTDGSGAGVFAQQFAADGSRVDGMVQINSETSSSQYQSAVDVLSDGRAIVVWQSQTSGSAGDGDGLGVFSRMLAAADDIPTSGHPILQGLDAVVQFDENTINSAPQLIDANTAAALSDSDGSGFEGGFLRVDHLQTAETPYQSQLAAPDNHSQHSLGLRTAEGITLSGADVIVDGVTIGAIVEDGFAGANFAIRFNANATLAQVERLVENLTYRNTSDDPDARHQVQIQIQDGDGGLSDPVRVTLEVQPEADGAAPVFGERQANTTTEHEQANSHVATLADGGFVIVWHSYRQEAEDNYTYGVYGQRFDANGNALGDEFQINTAVADQQTNPQVAALSDGGFVVSWTDAGGLDGSGQGVFQQRFGADGARVGSEAQVNGYSSSTQNQPAMTQLANGDYLVTWQSYNNTAAGGSSYDIFGQVFGSDGSTIGSEFLINSEVAASQETPAVTALASGGFAVSWTSQTSGDAGDGSSDGVFQRLYDGSSYAPLAAEQQVNSYTQNPQEAARMAALADGGFVTVWQSSGQDGSGAGVYGQRFDASGAPVGQEFRVNDQLSGSQHQVDVAALSHGGFVVVFSDNSGRDGSGEGVYAQQYDANGHRIDGALQVNSEISSAQYQPAVAALEEGGFVVSWTSQTSGSAGDGSSNGVFYQIFQNTTPLVSDVSATTAEDTTLALDSALFAAGFSDPEGQPLAEIRIDVLPSVGTLTYLDAPVLPGQVITVAELDAGALVFVPPLDFNGGLDFGWSGSDGSSFADTVALTNLTVTPVNDAVDLAPIGDQTVSEGRALNISALLGDPDLSDSYLVQVNYGDGSGVQSFTTSSKTPGLYHVFAAEGDYTVSLQVDDQQGSVENTSFAVTVVNAAPVAGNDYYSTDEDTAVASGNLFADDYDPGSDPFTISAINGVAYTAGDLLVLPSGATLVVNSDGSFSYDPSSSQSLQALAGGQSANDSFTYAISDDGGLSDTATVQVYVSGLDDNVVARDDLLTLAEDSSLAGNVLSDNGNGADFDPEGDALSILSVNGSETRVGAPLSVVGGGVLQINGDGSLSFVADGHYNELGVGEYRDISFSYVVQEAGSNLTASASGTIRITGVNDAPEARDDAVGTDENTAVTFVVLNDDYDVDGDNLSITALGAPEHGTVVLNLDGTLTYTPDEGFVGVDRFTYDISDGQGGSDQAEVQISVAGNQAPQAQNDHFSRDEASAISGNLFADNGAGVDSDPEGDDFTLTAINGAGFSAGNAITLPSGALLTVEADGRFSYDPNGAFEHLSQGSSGVERFSYEITDSFGNRDTAQATITLAGLNDAPTLAEGSAAISEDGPFATLNLAVLGADVDGDDTGGTLNYVISSAPAAGSASISGSTLRFDPGSDFDALNAGETATVTVGVTATDRHGVSSGETTMRFTITGANDAPVLTSGVLTAQEDGGAVSLDLSSLAEDADSEDSGDSLSYSLIAGPGAAQGSANISGTSLQFDPGLDFQSLGAGDSQHVVLQIQASDAQGATSEIREIVVTVDGVNDAPLFTSLDLLYMAENQTAVGQVQASDVDGGSPSYTLVGGADQALFAIDESTGALRFVAAPDYEVPADADLDNLYELVVRASDGSDSSDQFIFVEVSDVVETPVVTLVQGTNVASEQLTGTEGMDEIRTGGGRFDMLFGGAGGDSFVIEQLDDGQRDIVNILDFDAGLDVLDLNGRALAGQYSVGNTTYLMLDADYDTIILNGVSDLEEVMLVGLPQ